MKKMILISLILALFMLLTPMAVFGKTVKIAKTEQTVAKPVLKEEKAEKEKDTFRVFDTSTQKISQLDAKEYIIGVVCAEMPALYGDEALKAQAVASYTYACYKREENKDKDYDITTDFSLDQSFKNKEQAIADWGDKGQEYYEKVSMAVESVLGKQVLFKGKPIQSVYHALSCGYTYSAEEVWGKEIEYLQSVSSADDVLAENYLLSVEFTEQELKTKIEAFGIKPENGKKLVSELESNSSGLVTTLKLGGEKISGSELREILDLPSTNFSYEFKEEKHIFTCKGYGHGVGMSQRGADNMAKKGYKYDEILKHYYMGVQVK